MKGAFRFIQVSFVFTTSSHPVDALENAFDNAEDWLRIADHLWILYSDADLRTWRNRIKRVAGLLSTDTFFLSEFTIRQSSTRDPQSLLP